MSGSDGDQLAPRARRVHRLAEAEGFGLCGIAPATRSEHASWVRQWLADGKHGQMHYLADRLDKRLDPTALMSGARAIIVVADAYVGPWPDEPTCDPSGEPGDTPTGRITNYARGKDYHKTVKKRLHRVADALRERFPEASFKCTCDTAPTLEREHARRAGLGWVGKHTLLLHPRHGSLFFLGCIITDLALQTSADANYPGELIPPTDHCGTCTRCIDACPTQCIDDPDETGHRSIDATRCISYLTIEHRDVIDLDLHAAMGDWLAGCDVCQAVCPYNRPQYNSAHTTSADSYDNAEATGPLPLPAQQPGGQKLRDYHAPKDSAAVNERNAAGEDHSAQAMKLRSATGLPIHDRYRPRWPERWSLRAILDWDEADYHAALQGNALKRIKRPMWQRNALIVAGNYLQTRDDPPLRKRIEALAEDSAAPELVRTTARQVRQRLRSPR